jgi:hypothetical protein
MSLGETTECTWYFLNYMADIPLIPLFSYMLLWRVEHLLNSRGFNVHSGNYGPEEKEVSKRWM